MAEYEKSGSSSGVNPDNDDNVVLIALSFAPSLAFANMFSIFYLQVLSSIKKYKDTTGSFAIGHKVNNIVTAVTVFVFSLLFILQLCWKNSTDTETKNNI